MPTKIKFFISFLVLTISIFFCQKHYVADEFLKGILILIICFIMTLGLWILPEAKGKLNEINEKKKQTYK